MLEVKNISKTFYNSFRSVTALSDVSLLFDKSKIYGIIGPNGAGKTTLIKTICGLIYPDSGNVFIDNKPLYPSNLELLKNIGAILEGSRNIFWNFTPLQNVRYFALLKGIDLAVAESKAMKYFEIFNILDKINTPVRNLSQGMKQKIAIIISTLHNPSILLLDEPTLGLDPISSLKMQSLIKEIAFNEKKIVILTSHYLDIIEKNCDYLVFLKDGKVLFFDTVAKIKNNFSKVLYKFYVKKNDQQSIIEKILLRDEFEDFLKKLISMNYQIYDIEKMQPTLEEIFLQQNKFF